MSSLAILSALVSPMAPALAASSVDKDKIWSPPNTPLPRTASVPGKAEKPKAVPPATGSPNWVPPKTPVRATHGAALATLETAPPAGSVTMRKDAGGTEVREPAAGASRQAGDLPVWLAPLAPEAAPAKGSAEAPASDVAPAPGSVRVDVADAKAADALGVQGTLLALSRSGQAGASKVRVALDLGGVGFGGDFAERARLVALPACALTTPEVPSCLVRTPVPSHYDAQAKKLVADIELPAVEAPLTAREQSAGKSAALAPSAAPAPAALAPMVLATEGAPSSGTGTYSATSLSSSQAWTAGSSSGSFNYSYPIQSPPTLGGAAPQLALGYDSASVDGRTASTNSQASWIGDGWDLSSGFVERSYKPCAKAGIPGSADQCWGGANLTLSLGGHSGELVPHDTSCVTTDSRFEQSKCTWRLKNDDGTKVEFLTGAANGTWSESYLKVTDTSGTVYYFGLNQVPTAAGAPSRVGPESKSVWTVPVYSPNAGDPCYDAAKGKGSWCQMAWRWNLDYVVDPHHNLTTYSYAPETNWYARGGGQNPGAGVNTLYTRGGTLASIGYGQLDSDQIAAGGSYQPASKIDFETGERCIAANCDPSQRTSANAADWQDVPLDKQCAQSGACANTGPSYWSTKWLNTITTKVRSGGSYRPVDSYELVHSFKAPENPTENTRIPWLESVRRIGKDTFNGPEEKDLPKVTFASAMLPNRVDGLVPARPRYNRPRIEVITSETGGTISVAYKLASCSRTDGRMPASADDNTMSCYNVKWYDSAIPGTADDWFLRYPVASVTVDPNGNLVQGSVPKSTSYEYGKAAWHRNDGALVDSDYRTWDQFRGYASVTAVTGSGTDGAKSKSATYYYQGMDGDLKANGQTKTVTVAGPKSGAQADKDWLSGRVLESDSYTDADAVHTDPVGYTVNTSSGESSTATHKRTGLPDLEARYAATTSSSVSTVKTTGGTRTTSTVTKTDKDYNNRVKSARSTADGTPDLCTRTGYAVGSNPQMTGLVSEVLTVSGGNACDATATAANTVSGTRTLYDGAAFKAAGAKGEATGGQVLDRYDGSGTAQYVTSGASTYDVYGRVATVTDLTVSDGANPNGAVVTTSYSSANPGELPNRTVTGTPAPAGAPDAGSRRETTVTANPARNLPITTTDPNGRKVTQSYDSLGRLKAVWTPGRDTALSANYTYDYAVNGTTAPSTISSSTLRSSGQYGTATQIIDGLGRVIQTQSPPAISAYHGRLITDTFYDSQGRANQAYNTYYEDTDGPGTTRWRPDGAMVPNRTTTQFDGMGRPVSTQFIALGVLQNTTNTAYPGADRVDVTPPAGATATSTVNDARGRTAQLWQYRTPTATGNPADADVTTYTYTPGGQAATRVDAAGNSWSYGYDQRGRQIRADDPDTGVSTRSYDSAGRLAATTDARNQTVAVTYDLIGRKTGTYNGTVAPANQLTGYTYDTVAKGQAASSTRYVGGASGAAYTKAVTELDVAYRPIATTVSLPGSEIGKTGQVTFGYRAWYDSITGALVSESRAAAGSLADESITYKYEDYGLLYGMGGAGVTYLRQADWDAYGRNIRSTMNSWGTYLVATNTYDEPTGRLLNQYIDKQTAATGSVQNTTYAYNQAGQITAIRAIPNNTPSATDLQCFSYDYLGRLTTAWSDTGQLDQPTPSLGGQGSCANATPTSGASAPARTTVGGGAAYWQEYGYDLAGNRTKLVNHDPAGDPAKDLTAGQTFPAPGTRNTPTAAAGTGGGTGGPHALATGRSTFGVAAGVQGADEYDAAGNTTKINNPGGTKELKAGFVLNSGESVRSNSVQLAMQPDGNLVLSSLRTGKAVWSTNTQDHPGAWATMQDDGNFVVYDPQRVPLWSSRTWVGNNSGYSAKVQDDGNFIVVAPGGQAKWSSVTWNAVDAANGTTLTWDFEGKLASLTQGAATTTYVYDADGNQLVRRNPGKVTVNLGGGDELTYDIASNTSTGARYYSIPGGITLVREGPGKLAYQFSDHHGTSSLSIESATTNETRRTFDPFGATRGPGSLATPWSGDKGYVGGLKDDATGFTNLGARQYQPGTGRFLSPDPILDAGDPLQWNAYAYSNNNPVNRSDPNGLKSEECGTLYDCGSAGTITMKNAAETTANNVSAAALQRLDDTQRNSDYYDSAQQAGFGPKPAKSQRKGNKGAQGSADNGIIMVRFFIPEKEAAFGSLLGDNRSWSRAPVDSARMTLFWNTATGEANFTVMPSVTAEGHVKPGSKDGEWVPQEVESAKGIDEGESYWWTTVRHRNAIAFRRSDGGGLAASIHGINSKMPIFGTDVQINIEINSFGIRVNRKGDDYPNMEVVQYRRGKTPNLLAQDPWGAAPGDPGLLAIPALFDIYKINRTHEEGRCISGC